MSILTGILLFLGIHLLELIGYGIYVIIQKNNKLQKLVEGQQQVLSDISQVIEYSNIKIREIDAAGSFSSDDEVGFFFKGLQEIQETLNNYITT